MLRLPITEVKPGMILGKSIVGDHGDLLLASGFVINEIVLAKMRDMDINCCWIFEPGTEMIVPEEMIAEQLAMQARGVLRQNSELLKKVLGLRAHTLEAIQKAMGEPKRFRNVIAVEQFRSVVRDILAELLEQEPVAVNLDSQRTKSGYLFQHSLDVAITAILLAQKLGLPYREMEELALGCLLMDTGLVLFADSMLQKNEPFNEAEASLFQEHPAFGYAILRENRGISLTTAHVAYQHHEWQNGCGYPRGLLGNNLAPTKNLTGEKNRIHRFAEIAAVADFYVSMIAPRPGTVAEKSPEEAVKSLIVAAGAQLNKAVVDAMITLIPVFPTGAKVVVVRDRRDQGLIGYTGVVAKTRMDKPEQPLVIVLNSPGKKKIKPFTLDLTEEPGLKIQFCRL